ncbi:MAG: hypothetical protein J6T24_06715 [Clostridia bacterium]|nr:hypothetical protein [Clostridia bacterium]
MKRSLLFFLLLAVAALLLVACGGTTPAETTPPSSTTEAATTTTAVTTTVMTTTVTTAPALPVSENYIKETQVLSGGGLRITYRDGTKLNLGRLDLREGYNSASIAHTLDRYTGILTLTVTESASVNIANRQLGTAATPTALSLRENNGLLEWTLCGTEDWAPLCRADGRGLPEGVTPLYELADILSIGRVEKADGDKVVLVISENKLRFRAREWKDGTDLVTDAKLGGSANKKFNMSTIAEIPASLSLESISTAKVDGYLRFKDAGDDIKPIQMNGTNIGANHGYYVISAIKNPMLDPKDESDIGSIWEADGVRYVLVRITATKEAGGEVMLWFCPYYDEAMETGYFNYKQIAAGATITHVSGATHTESFTTADASVQAQFYIALNHYYEAAFLNGTEEVDLYKDGTYTAEFIDFYEEYDLIYLPTMLEALIDNVGWNTDMSHCSEDIADSYVTFQNTYRFHKNGACVVYSEYDFHKDVKITYMGGVQSGKFAEETHYIYVPGTTNLAVPTLQGSATVNVGVDHLAIPDRLTTSYFQFTDDNGTKGMNIGFNPLYGTAVNEVRWNYIGKKTSDSNLAFYYNTYKMYPRLISNCELAAGTKISCVAYRLPSYILDDDFTAINWYWVGDDIYLSLHTDTPLQKTVTVLPEYMNGMSVEVIEASYSFDVQSKTVENGSINILSSSEGYAIIKLSPKN